MKVICSFVTSTGFFQAIQWLDVCGRHGITLNPEKFVFAEKAVEFAGFEITTDSVNCRKTMQKVPRGDHKLPNP